MSRSYHRGRFGVAVAVALLVQLAACCSQAAVIVHRYNFEGDNADDSAGTLDGLLQGDPLFTANAAAGSRAIVLDGAGSPADHIGFPDPMEFGRQFSIAAWVLPEPGALGIQTLVSNAPGGWATDGFKLYYNTWSDPATADRALLLETGNGTAGEVYGTTAGAITEGMWNHVVTTVDMDSGAIHFYLDGSERVGSGGLVADMSTNLPWEIGRMVGSWPLAGTMDDVQIYQGVLTPEEALELYRNPGFIVGQTAPVLTWNQGGSNLWHSANWDGGPPDVPDSTTHAALGPNNTDTVTVAADGEAFSLTVDGGAVAISAGRTLRVATTAHCAPGTTVSLGADAALVVAQGGGIHALSTAGGATIDIGGDLAVATYDDGGVPGSFTKLGIGTLTFNNDSGTAVDAADTTLRIDAGTLASSGDDPLGGAAAVVLGGGTLSLSGKTITHRYDFENDSGEDSIGNVDGSLQGGPAFSGEAMSGSRSMVLDGAGSHLDFPNPMEFGRQFSIATWLKPDPAAMNIQTLVANAPGGYTTDGFKLFYNTWQTTDGRVIVESGNGVDGAGYATDEGVITGDAWKHIVATLDLDLGEVRVYVDGVETLGGGGVVSDMNTNLDWEIGQMPGGALPLLGTLDDVQIYSGALNSEQANWLYANPGSVIQQILDMGGTQVTVTADSGVHTGGPAMFGGLRLEAGVLATSGGGAIRFAGTTVDGGPDVGFATFADTRPGAIDGGSAAVVITKTGPADLILDEEGVGLEGATFDVQQGRLVGYHGPNPVAGSVLQLSGGEVLLSAKPDADSPVLYDNALTVTAPSVLSAGAGDDGAAAPMTVTVGSRANGVQLANGTLQLRSTDDYVLDIAGSLTGSGGIEVTSGSVLLSAADSAVGTLAVSGGTLDTAGNDVAVSGSLTLGKMNMNITPGDTFTIRGSDLLDETAARHLTLSGGTLSIINSPIAHRYDFENDSGDDSLGLLHGSLQGDPTFSDDAVSGNRSIVLDGAGDYIDFSDPTDFGREFSFAVWVRPDPAAPSQIQTIVANAVGGYGTDGFKLFYNHWETRDLAIVIESGNGSAGSDYATSTDTVVEDQWNHIVATFDMDAGTVRVYHNGLETTGSGTFAADMTTNSDWEIGRMKGAYELVGQLDDMQIYGMVLSAEEAAWLYNNPGAPIQGALDLAQTNVAVAADSALYLDTSLGDATFGDLLMEPGMTLTITGAPASVEDLSAADSATIRGELLVRGRISPAEGIGTLTVDGGIEMAEDAGYLAELAGPDADLVTVPDGDVYLAGTLTLHAIDKVLPAGLPWGNATRTIMTTQGEGGIEDSFSTVPTEGDHLGRGVFYRGLTYAANALQVDLFQAADGDADGDRDVDGDDIQAVLAGNTFPRRNPADWSTGDFTGDGWCDGDDIQLILATNLFGQGPYASMLSDAEDALQAGTAVPEPSTLAMLVAAVIALFTGACGARALLPARFRRVCHCGNQVYTELCRSSGS